MGYVDGFTKNGKTLKRRYLLEIAQSAGAVEYTDCTSVEG